ncbi:phosphate regulon transcriptional regulator PhoB [Thiohalophilus sp.]|uniref:phosphate regulon transcriptional regulator PhoB n=1 Tax=Thiohalophilus sp. TaxID=3028392 RepID=UPI002ACE0475|nr:phosphate regulon transcriptional regulator PhoB [Thiohalophilus sp.]MDZ7663631.1 phosphate regulon transcriptional regulator PhoB [Thiohalophilus sp.]
MSQDITLLVVEDEAAIREMLEFTLARAGFRVIEAGDAREAGERLAEEKPDLVLLDWMLPGISGVEFAKRLRRDEATRDLPVIMLTARTEEESKLRGYEAGIDDYVTKPFSTQELVARIRAVLRRSSAGQEASETIEIAGLTLDTASHRVSLNGEPINLGPTEFRLLHFFMTHPERVYSRDQLLDQVWGNQVYIEDRTVDVHIRRLRKALAPHGFDRHVQTVRGAGYRFSKQV